MVTTEKYGLKKPSPEDFYNVADFNDNMDVVEAELEKRARRPAAQTAGNFAALTAQGDLADAGLNANSFLAAGTKATAIGGEAAGAAAVVQNKLDTHLNDNTKHFTAADRTKLTAALTETTAKPLFLAAGTKATAIGGEAAGAAAAVQTKLNTHLNDNTKHFTTADRTRLKTALTTSDIVVSKAQPPVEEDRVWIKVG